MLLPPAFITLSFIVTPDAALTVRVPEGGTTLEPDVGMADLHGALMVPMTVAFLAGILGLFVMLSSREADRRLVSAGYPLGRLLAVRLGIVAGMTLVITLIAVGVTLIDFRPPQLGMFFLVNLLSALHYAFLGAVVGTFLSPMSGTYLMFFVPMIDIGLIQNPMFPRDAVAWWAQLLPGLRADGGAARRLVHATASTPAGRWRSRCSTSRSSPRLALFAFWRVTAPRGGRRS